MNIKDGFAGLKTKISVILLIMNPEGLSQLT